MRLSQTLAVFVVAMLWAAPLRAQSAFEQLEQQVQRDNARAAAGQLAASPPGQEPGYLGVIAEDRQGGGKGLSVIEVIAGAPAETAGLKASDFITSIDGQAVTSMQDFERILSAAPAGKKLAFQFSRNGQAQTIGVTLGQRPPPGKRRFEQFGPIPATDAATAPAEARGATLGVRIASVTPDLQRTLGLPSASGALVVAVVEGSAASRAGIMQGNVILSVDNQHVETPTDLSRLIAQSAPGREVTIGYFNGTATVERKTALGSGAPPAAPPGQGSGAPVMPSPPLGGQYGGAPMSSPYGGAPGQPGGPGPGPMGMPGQYGAPGAFGNQAPGQFGNQAPGGADVLQMLDQRVRDLERRVRQLEQTREQPPPAGAPKATRSSNQQT